MVLKIQFTYQLLLYKRCDYLVFALFMCELKTRKTSPIARLSGGQQGLLITSLYVIISQFFSKCLET